MLRRTLILVSTILGLAACSKSPEPRDPRRAPPRPERASVFEVSRRAEAHLARGGASGAALAGGRDPVGNFQKRVGPAHRAPAGSGLHGSGADPPGPSWTTVDSPCRAGSSLSMWPGHLTTRKMQRELRHMRDREQQSAIQI